MTAGLAGCEQAPAKAGDEIPSLKNAYDGAFMIGAAVNVLQTTGIGNPNRHFMPLSIGPGNTDYDTLPSK